MSLERIPIDQANVEHEARELYRLEKAKRMEIEPGTFEALVPPAVRHDWPECTRCERPIAPGWAVRRGGGTFHPICVMRELGERAGVVLGRDGARGLSAQQSEVPLPAQGAAGLRSAASGTSDAPSREAA